LLVRLTADSLRPSRADNGWGRAKTDEMSLRKNGRCPLGSNAGMAHATQVGLA